MFNFATFSSLLYFSCWMTNEKIERKSNLLTHEKQMYKWLKCTEMLHQIWMKCPQKINESWRVHNEQSGFTYSRRNVCRMESMQAWVKCAEGGLWVWVSVRAWFVQRAAAGHDRRSEAGEQEVTKPPSHDLVRPASSLCPASPDPQAGSSTCTTTSWSSALHVSLDTTFYLIRFRYSFAS